MCLIETLSDSPRSQDVYLEMWSCGEPAGAVELSYDLDRFAVISLSVPDVLLNEGLCAVLLILAPEYFTQLPNGMACKSQCTVKSFPCGSAWLKCVCVCVFPLSSRVLTDTPCSVLCIFCD